MDKTRDPIADVLTSPELLESILLACPMRTVLTAQRVSTHFNAIVQSSLQLQRYLFLAPTTSELLADPETCLLPPPRRTPIGHSRNRVHRVHHPCQAFATSSGHQCILNPMLPHIWTVRKYPNSSIADLGTYLTIEEFPAYKRDPFKKNEWTLTHPLHAKHEFIDPHNATLHVFFDPQSTLDPAHESLNYPEASWRRMYLTQPPSHCFWAKATSPRPELSLAAFESIRPTKEWPPPHKWSGSECPGNHRVMLMVGSLISKSTDVEPQE